MEQNAASPEDFDRSLERTLIERDPDIAAAILSLGPDLSKYAKFARETRSVAALEYLVKKGVADFACYENPAMTADLFRYALAQSPVDPLVLVRLANRADADNDLLELAHQRTVTGLAAARLDRPHDFQGLEPLFTVEMNRGLRTFLQIEQDLVAATQDVPEGQTALFRTRGLLAAAVSQTTCVDQFRPYLDDPDAHPRVIRAWAQAIQFNATIPLDDRIALIHAMTTNPELIPGGLGACRINGMFCTDADRLPDLDRMLLAIGAEPRDPTDPRVRFPSDYRHVPVTEVADAVTRYGHEKKTLLRARWSLDQQAVIAEKFPATAVDGGWLAVLPRNRARTLRQADAETFANDLPRTKAEWRALYDANSTDDHTRAKIAFLVGAVPLAKHILKTADPRVRRYVFLSPTARKHPNDATFMPGPDATVDEIVLAASMEPDGFEYPEFGRSRLDWLHSLATHPDVDVRRSVAQNDQVRIETVTVLATDPDPVIGRSLAARGLLSARYSPTSKKEREALTGIFRALAAHPEPDVRAQAVRSDWIPEDALIALSDDEDEQVKAAVSERLVKAALG